MSGGFMDMFGMMNDMIGNMEHMTAGGTCQTFSSSTVISYSNTGDGAPKVYQETSPGGIRETRRTVRDSDSGLEQMSMDITSEIGLILQRPRNHRTGDQEEGQDYINLDESEAAAFDDEWRRETSRFRQQRLLEFRRHEASGASVFLQHPGPRPSLWPESAAFIFIADSGRNLPSFIFVFAADSGVCSLRLRCGWSATPVDPFVPCPTWPLRQQARGTAGPTTRWVRLLRSLPPEYTSPLSPPATQGHPRLRKRKKNDGY
ncbi:hypothetical protein QTO34_017120 [Cnephaeus nilssonii]|uniref:Myeloid leukemia factor 2 n=1 Tax=Cnephaeus nilssonii TaxID=3371016 RepID=A0AA40I0H8_CNENI|nr:hypothetical protein QTO34_017120 [Eptesicus nilssonii]